MKTKMTTKPIDTKKDNLLQMAIQQGYVPLKCNLAGGLVMALMNDGVDPCVECNADRNKCGGRAKTNKII